MRCYLDNFKRKFSFAFCKFSSLIRLPPIVLNILLIAPWEPSMPQNIFIIENSGTSDNQLSSMAAWIYVATTFPFIPFRISLIMSDFLLFSSILDPIIKLYRVRNALSRFSSSRLSILFCRYSSEVSVSGNLSASFFISSYRSQINGIQRISITFAISFAMAALSTTTLAVWPSARPIVSLRLKNHLENFFRVW